MSVRSENFRNLHLTPTNILAFQANQILLSIFVKTFSMQLLDGKATAAQIRLELADAVKKRKQEGKKIPHLAAILVGNDGGSVTYVNAKVKACEEIGFESTLIRYDDSVPEEILLGKVQSLNEDKSIDN